MAINLTFLSASLPLTKTIEKLSDGTLHKSPYPLITNFTSETVEVKNIQEFPRPALPGDPQTQALPAQRQAHPETGG